MPDRNISLSSRKEGTRDKNDTSIMPIQFELEQIKQHFYDSLEDINNQTKIVSQLYETGYIEEAKDILRSQIVFLEGILDFYIHELSKYGLIRMFTGKWPKSNAYNDLRIPMCTVEMGLRNPESTSWLFDRLNIRFGAETYLNPDQLSKQLSLIGMKLNDICKKAYPKENNSEYVDGKTRLQSLFVRRNQIAHQADRKHSNAEKEDIDSTFVQNAISLVTSLIEAIHEEAISKDE